MRAVLYAFDMGEITADEAKAAIVASIRGMTPNAELTERPAGRPVE